MFSDSELCAKNFYHEMRCTDTAAAEIPKKTPNDWANTNLLGHDSLRGMGRRREEGQSKFADTVAVAQMHFRSRAFSVKSGKLRAFFRFSFVFGFLLAFLLAPFPGFRPHPSVRPSSLRRTSTWRWKRRRRTKGRRSGETGGENDGSRLDKTCSIIIKVCNKET